MNRINKEYKSINERINILKSRGLLFKNETAAYNILLKHSYFDIINANEVDMKTSASAIGIRNVKQRCKLIYGDKAEYTFYNMQGAVSELILPINEERVKDECISN